MRCWWLFSRQASVFLVVLFLGTAARPIPATAKGPHLLKDVWVVQQRGQWHVVLIGPESVTYKATKVSDPPRVVVDLPNTLSKPMIMSPIRENEIIDRVKTSTIVHEPQPLTRVEIGLNLDASYEIRRKQEMIWISFNMVPPITRAEPSSTETAAETEAEITPPEPKTQRADTPKSSPEEQLPSAKEPLPPASKILAIEPVAVEKDFDLHIIGNGRFDRYDAFLLYDPPRLVVDFLDLKSTEVKNVVSLNLPWAKRTRVGQHPGKVRVVLDLNFTPEGELSFQFTFEKNRLVVSRTSNGQT